jgi:hypothetical protein
MNQSNQTLGASFAQSNLKAPSPHYFARLMSPAEVAEATVEQPEAVRGLIDDRWVLCGDVSEQMFSMLQGSTEKAFPTRVTGLSTKEGAHYAVISHQIFNWQHRFLLPLYDEYVQAFIKVASTGRIAYLLGNDGASEAIVFDNIVPAKSFFPVVAMCKPMTQEAQEDAMLEMSFIIDELAQPGKIPTLLERQAVKYVSVSAIMPQVLKHVLHEALFGMRQ